MKEVRVEIEQGMKVERGREKRKEVVQSRLVDRLVSIIHVKEYLINRAQ